MHNMVIHMGQLKPGATYIYERNGDTVFRRESGADPSTREVMGYDYPATDGTPRHDSLIESLMDSKMWGEIHRMAKTNPTLQDALDRVIMIYRLSKTT
jgi:hypothetical protein